jgi:hypothetical protein
MMNLTLNHLIDRLRTMPAATIRQVGSLVREEHRCAADEIAWWNATIRVDRLVHRQHQRHMAASAATTASRAVLHAASRCGLRPNDPDVIATARAASDAARAVVAGRGSGAATTYFIERLGPVFAMTTPSAAVA